MRFTIAHTAEEERIIVTIDCRLRFVCGEVEVCIFSSFCLFVCLCVSNPFFRREPRSRFSWISVGESSTGSLLRIYIYVCVLFREFQNVVSWWSEICSGCNPNSFFFLVIVISFVDEFNRTKTKNRVKRNVVAIVVVCCLLSLLLVVVAVYFNERETFSTRDVAVLFESYFAVLLLHTYRCFLLFSVCCCSVIILLSENSYFNFERR